VRMSALSLCALMAAPALLHAQPPRLHESLVVTAAGEPVPFENLARDVWVLTHDQIARLPVRSVDELLRFAATVDVRARGPFGVQADLSIRGGSFGQALVLVDGVRMNDAQSGHHNLDIPLTLDDIERIEVLAGPGSSLFGADALSGTINIITRAGGRRVEGEVAGGEHGLAHGRLRAGQQRNRVDQSFASEGSRSSGFMFDRDFELLTASSRTAIGTDTRLVVGHVRKDFGANGFYGPSPSREWTDQTIAGVARDLEFAGWRATTQALYRTHGDHFLYDVRTPGVAENFHRTHAATFLVRGARAVGRRTRATAGIEAGGDWIGSSNLGDHTSGRASALRSCSTASAIGRSSIRRCGTTGTRGSATRGARRSRPGSASHRCWRCGPRRAGPSASRPSRSCITAIRTTWRRTI
jgi:outer membrane receptor protein involved in Fe transport